MNKRLAPQPVDTALAHACAICGAANAQFGFRLPGRLADLPTGKRGYLWACKDHREAALARQQAATTITKHEAPK